MKKSILPLALVLLLLPVLIFAGGKKEAESNEVVIYTALEEDETADYLELAKRKCRILI